MSVKSDAIALPVPSHHDAETRSAPSAAYPNESVSSAEMVNNFDIIDVFDPVPLMGQESTMRQDPFTGPAFEAVTRRSDRFRHATDAPWRTGPFLPEEPARPISAHIEPEPESHSSILAQLAAARAALAATRKSSDIAARELHNMNIRCDEMEGILDLSERLAADAGKRQHGQNPVFRSPAAMAAQARELNPSQDRMPQSEADRSSPALLDAAKRPQASYAERSDALRNAPVPQADPHAASVTADDDLYGDAPDMPSSRNSQGSWSADLTKEFKEQHSLLQNAANLMAGPRSAFNMRQKGETYDHYRSCILGAAKRSRRSELAANAGRPKEGLTAQPVTEQARPGPRPLLLDPTVPITGNVDIRQCRETRILSLAVEQTTRQVSPAQLPRRYTQQWDNTFPAAAGNTTTASRAAITTSVAQPPRPTIDYTDDRIINMINHALSEAGAQPAYPVNVGKLGIKIQAPTYSGEPSLDAFERFITNFLNFLKIYQLCSDNLDRYQIYILGTCLIKDANEWYAQTIDTNDKHALKWAFEDVVLALKARFVHKASSRDAATNYDLLTQSTKTVMDYYNLLRSYSTHMIECPSGYDFSRRFTDGLNASIRKRVLELGITPEHSSMADLLRHAVQIESSLQYMSKDAMAHLRSAAKQTESPMAISRAQAAPAANTLRNGHLSDTAKYRERLRLASHMSSLVWLRTLS